MIRASVAGFLALASVAACATLSDEDAPPMAGDGPCDANRAQGLVGQSASQSLASEAMRLSGAREFRWIPPNSAVTMDYRPTRLNVEYDEASRVTAIRCG